MHLRNWLTSIWIGGLTGIVMLPGIALAETRNTQLLHDVAELYEISYEAAAKRLANESIAASQYRLVRSLNLKGFAGAWFDEGSARLVVASNRSVDRQQLATMNIESVLVDHDLSTLQELVDNLADRFLTIGMQRDFRSAYVDVRANMAVIVVSPETQRMAEIHLDEMITDGRAVILTQANLIRPSSGNFRAAEGTRNFTWGPDKHGNLSPCSIGASTVNGFVWAGHCGYWNNKILDTNEEDLGYVSYTTWWSNQRSDIGKVTTEVGWTPTPTVEGYNHGLFNISREWSGLTEYPVNSTVCRYGEASQHASCGTIDAGNVTIISDGKRLDGTTRVTGMCSDDGDSGGPHIAGGSHMQGVNIAKTEEETTCPYLLQYVYFQPMAQVLQSTGAIMLTPHGSSAPNVTSAMCPDPILSGPGQFLCYVNSVDSQGGQSFSWTSNTGHSSNQIALSGSCTTGSSVLASLETTNPYGSSLNQYSFTCP